MSFAAGRNRDGTLLSTRDRYEIAGQPLCSQKPLLLEIRRALAEPKCGRIDRLASNSRVPIENEIYLKEKRKGGKIK